MTVNDHHPPFERLDALTLAQLTDALIALLPTGTLVCLAEMDGGAGDLYKMVDGNFYSHFKGDVYGHEPYELARAMRANPDLLVWVTPPAADAETIIP